MNEGQWTSQYRLKIQGDNSLPDVALYRYRHSGIKKDLVFNSYDKCIYCETKISHAQYGDVEHIVPKSKRPDLVVEWTNLALVCKVCNVEKSDYWKPDEPLINPFNEDPREFLGFYGPAIMHRPGSHKGRRTIQRLKLQRAALFERRKERIQQVQPLLDVWANMPESSDKELIENQLVLEKAKDKEYSAAVESYLWASAGI